MACRKRKPPASKALGLMPAPPFCRSRLAIDAFSVRLMSYCMALLPWVCEKSNAQPASVVRAPTIRYRSSMSPLMKGTKPSGYMAAELRLGMSPLPTPPRAQAADDARRFCRPAVPYSAVPPPSGSSPLR